MPTTRKFLTCIGLALIAAVTIGAISAEAGGGDPPCTGCEDPDPPRGPSAPVELPGAETP